MAVNRGDRPLPDLSPLRAICGSLADSRVGKTSGMPQSNFSATDVRHRVVEDDRFVTSFLALSRSTFTNMDCMDNRQIPFSIRPANTISKSIREYGNELR